MQYDFNKDKIYGRGRKQLPIIRMWEKLGQNLVRRKLKLF